MRKIVIFIFFSLHGVMQAPEGKEEDPSGGFALEGRTVPYLDGESGKVRDGQMGQPFDLLLGRRTYMISSRGIGRKKQKVTPLPKFSIKR